MRHPLMNLVNTTLSQKYGDPYVIKSEHLRVCTKMLSLHPRDRYQLFNEILCTTKYEIGAILGGAG